jgi:cytochrome c-type biogenesis protein CcmH
MIALWLAAGLLAVAVFGLVVLLSGQPVLAGADAARNVYRRQLAEIDDLATRGLLGEDERKASYAEAGRRLLDEDDPQPETPPTPAARNTAIVVAAGVAVLALALYLAAGRPETRDEPFSARLKTWQNNPNPLDLTAGELEAVVKAKLKGNPDPNGFLILAQTQVAQNELTAAGRNLEKSTIMNPANAEVWEMLGKVRVADAKGKLTPDARDAFNRALAIDPKRLDARYYLARGQIDAGDIPGGVAALTALLPDIPAERQVDLRTEIAQIQGAPDAATVAEVKSQTPANGDVTANPAIKAMVAGLAERLKQSPDDPAGWQRLVRSYTVLKDPAGLNKALADARAYFKNRPQDLAAIEQAAKAPGQ